MAKDKTGLTQGWTVKARCTYVPHERAWGEDCTVGPREMFINSIEEMLDERSLYDDPLDGDKHYKAKRVASRLGITVLDYYDFFIAEKDERAAILAERGEFHADSCHDAACYRKLKADYIAGK